MRRVERRELRVRVAVVAPALAVLTAFAACGGSGGSSQDVTARISALPGVGDAGTVTCRDADGCSLVLPHGARLDVPPGALTTDTVTLTVATTVRSSDDLRSFTYQLGPDGTRFRRPVTFRFPILEVAGEAAADLWCRQSLPDAASGTATFDDGGLERADDGTLHLRCALGHFSSVEAAASPTFAVIQGFGVAASALDACRDRGFSSESACTGVSGGTVGCSYCGGHNGCWIPGGGGGCCPDEDRALDDGCWLSFQEAPVGAQPDACLDPGGSGRAQGFSSYDRCVNAGTQGIECSYCGGHNECWIPGGGGSCCPGETDPTNGCHAGMIIDGGVFSSGGCWDLIDLTQQQSACGGFGYWTEAPCVAANGWCQYCGGHNECWTGSACPGETCEDDSSQCC